MRVAVAALLALLLFAHVPLRAQEEDKAKEARARIVALDAKVAQLYGARKYPEARARAEEALKLAEEALGADDRATAECLNNLAMVLRAMGDLKGARPLLERAAAAYEKALGPDHLDTAGSLDNLARVMQAMGDLKGARPLLERALAIREKALGPEHPMTAASLGALASVLQAMGDLAGARPLLERALAVNEKVLGPDHLDTAACLNNLADLLRALGDLKGARALFGRALAVFEKTLGPDHPDTATLLNNLAYVLQTMGDLKGARPLYERALAIREKVFGPDRPETAGSLNNLAYLLQAMGDVQGARPLYERALAINEKRLGQDHPDTARALNNLGMLLAAMGDLEGARPLVERAAAIWEKALPPDHPDVAASLNNLAVLLQVMGDLKGARPLFERALALREKALGEDHPDTAASLEDLAYLLMAMGDMKGARPLCERALAIQERVLGPDHPQTPFFLNTLADVVQALGDTKQARPLYERAWSCNVGFLRTLLPVLSSRERCAAVRRRSHYLGEYLHALGDEPVETYAAVLAWKCAALRADAATLRLPSSAPPEARRAADDLTQARRALARLALSPHALKAGEASMADQCDDARKRIEALERELAKALPDFARRAFLEAELPAVREALPEGAAMLDMLVNGGTVYAWVVRREGDVASFSLGKASELAPLVERFRAAIERDDEKGWKEAGGALREKLGQALSAALAGSKTLYVSPDGVLATIPWGLLPDGDGFLIERLPIVCVSGGGAGLVMAANTPRSAGAEGLLAIGGVDYEHAEGATGKGTRPERQASALPSTKEEADQVAKRFGERFPKAPLRALTGSLATVARFEKLAPSARFIHVATHGYFDTEHLAVALGGATRGFSSPLMSAEVAASERQQNASAGGWNPLLLSGIVMAGANAGDGGGGSDGLLAAEELQGLDLAGTELVVLSACETGRGELAAGEGVLGLSRALFVAGAKGFMLSLWAVPDDDTREVMEGFYDALWCGRGAGTRPARTLEEAMRSTQLRMILRDRENKAFRPSTWGAWVLLQ